MQILSVASALSQSAYAVSPSAGEMATARDWVADKIDGVVPELPFSFTYGGEASRAFLPLASQAKWTWDIDRDEKQLDEHRAQRTLTYTDPRTGLEVRCEAIVYADYPAVEWLVTFRNNGDEDSPILEDILAMDVSLTRPGPGEPEYRQRWIEWKGQFETIAVRRDPGEFVVHHATGGIHSIRAFEPHEDELGPDQRLTIGGISSQPDLPFFNVEWPGEGIIAGLGWTAPWKADLVRDADQSLGVKVYAAEWTDPATLPARRTQAWQTQFMSGARFLLHPGEHVRVPRMLVMFWSGDRIRGHNLWRRLLLDHYAPRRHGEPVPVPTGASSQWHNQQQVIEIIDWYAENRLPIEYYWLDLGWQRAPTDEEAPEYLADDVVNEKMFPDGMRAVSDAAHKHGVKHLLWFGGNRDTRFQATYPRFDMIRRHRPDLLSEEYPGSDNGNPMINEWMIEHFSKMIEEHGIDIFRWDNRSWPLPDAREDRKGIHWARSAEGFYEFWDALLERFPDLVIDCCGGGAVNLDLETMRRSVVLWRCDHQCGGIHDPENVFDPVGIQTQTHSVSLWAPLTGGAVRDMTPYAFRSAYSPGVNVSMPDAHHTPFDEYVDPDLARRLLNEYLSVRHCFYGDYYPLTRWTLAQDAWMAWQFDRPDLGEGIVQVFRRSESAAVTCEYRLHALDMDAEYKLTDLDVSGTTQATGRALTEEGLRVTMTDRSSAVVVRYRKVS